MAENRAYRVTVATVLANSTAGTLGDWVEMVRRAKAQADAIMGAPAKGGTSPAAREGKERVSEAKKAADELKRIREKENDDILKDVEKHTKAQEKGLAYIAKIKERYFAEEQRRGERADAERAARNEKLVSGSIGYMRQAAGVASRVAGQLVSGMGVSFDVSSSMQRGANVDETARRTAISGMGAKDLNASEADVQKVIATVRAAGDASKQSYGAMAEGLEEFVSKSSDLDTGEKVLGDLGKIARATGTDVKFLVSAAGDVNKTLDDSPNKAQELLDVMTLVATQSAKGAVEVKDFAKYMGKITAGAFKFEGTKQQNIGILSSLAQVSMKGGAANAADAVRAAQAFTQDITKGKALSRFEGAGLKIFTDDSKTQLRSPEKIITDFLRMSKGNIAELSKYFQNTGSRNVMTGFSSIYTAAGGGEKGIKAVEDEFKKFSMTMSKQDIKQRFELSAEGRAAKAQDFQNKLDKIVDVMADRVIPAFEKVEEPALKVAEALSGLVVSAAEHPWTAIAAVIGGSIAASIAKAAIGDTIGKGIGNMLGALGPAGIGLGLLAVAAAAAAAAIADYEAKSDKAHDALEKDLPVLIKKAEKQLKETGTIDKDTIDEIARQRADIAGVQAMRGKSDMGADKLSYSQVVAAKITGGADQVANAEGAMRYGEENKDTVDKTAAKLDELIATWKATQPKKGEVQHVHIDNLPAAGVTAPTGGTVSQ